MRTFVHHKVRDVILAAYEMLETEQAGTVFEFAEFGSQQGGGFWPPKTHQIGLSVDFMVPVLDESGKSVYLIVRPLEYPVAIFGPNTTDEDFSTLRFSSVKKILW